MKKTNNKTTSNNRVAGTIGAVKVGRVAGTIGAVKVGRIAGTIGAVTTR